MSSNIAVSDRLRMLDEDITPDQYVGHVNALYASQGFAGSWNESTLFNKLTWLGREKSPIIEALSKNEKIFQYVETALTTKDDENLLQAVLSFISNFSSPETLAHLHSRWTPCLLRLLDKNQNKEGSLPMALANSLTWTMLSPGSAQYAIPYLPLLIQLYSNEELSEHILVVLCNVAADETITSQCREGGLVEFFSETHFDSGSTVLVTMALANLVGQIENHPLLNTNAETIEELATIMTCSLHDEPYGDLTFELFETLQVMANLSVNDNNKVLLYKQNLTSDILAVFQDHSSERRAVLYAIKYISNMSFKYDILHESAPLLKAVQGLAKSDAKRVREYAEIALFQYHRLHPQTRPPTATLAASQTGGGSTHAPVGHIMLSYPWKYQEFFLWLKKYLQSQGYTVWMDVDQMSSSVLEAMAGAVENSSVILYCLSGAYKESEACRTEGEYGYNLRKAMIPVKTESGYKPTGWLGALTGNKLYFEFTRPDQYDEKAKQLLLEIKRYAQPHQAVSTGDIIAIAPPPPQAAPTAQAPAANTTAQVQQAGSESLGKQVAELQSLVNRLEGLAVRLERLEARAAPQSTCCVLQ